MLFTRKIGRILTGKVAPWQAGCGAFLGVVAGFVPAGAAPACSAALVGAAVLLNVNLVLLGGALAGARLLALLLAPVLFATGQFVLDGPFAPVMRHLVNAPILAYGGFDSYLAVGGMIFGLALGGVAAAVASRGLRRFRTFLASLDEASPRFRQINSSRSFKVASFVLLGGIAKFSELRAMPRARAVRPLGAVLLVLLVVLGFALSRFLAGPIVTYVLQDTLERFNGATVDVGSVELDAGAGRLTIERLAMADPNALDRDLLRAGRLEADIGLTDLLRKRVRIDRLAMHNVTSGERRALPGALVGRAPSSAPRLQWPDARNLEDYVRNAATWKERLAQARRWLQQLETAQDKSIAEDPDAARRRREAAAQGYAQIKATHLVSAAPTLLIRQLEIAGLTVAALPGKNFRIVGTDLSTAPALAPEPLVLSAESADGKIRSRVQLAGRTGTFELQWSDLPAEQLADGIVVRGQPVFAGGTLDLRCNGTIDAAAATMNLPLQVTLHDTTLRVAGRTQPVRELTVPIQLSGAIDNPAIRIEPQAITRALAQAGASRLLDDAGEHLGDKLGPAAASLLDRLQGKPEPRPQ